MPLTWRRNLVGLGVALAIVAIVVLAWQRPNPFDSSRTARAVFDDAAGLAVVGGEVQIAGVPVGKIGTIDREGDDAVVELHLEDGAPDLHADATARLRPRLAFEGTAFVEVEPGTPGAGELRSPIRRTATYVSLERVLRLADRPTREHVRGTVRGLAGALRGGGSDLNATLARAPRLLRDTASAADAARAGGALRRAVGSLATTSSAVAARQDDLAPLLRSTSRTAVALNGPRLRAALTALPAAAGALDRGGRSLHATLDRLRPLARELRPAARELDGGLRTVRPLLREAAPALRSAAPLLRDVDGALESLTRGAVPTRRLLAALDPSVRTLDATLLPALLRPTKNLELPAYLAFLNMFEGGGGASRPFVGPGDPGSENGTGHFMRFGFRFLTGMGMPLPPCGLLKSVNAELAEQLAKAGACTP